MGINTFCGIYPYLQPENIICVSLYGRVFFQEEGGRRAEMEQMINMMKNYKNRLFLANHGKRSIVEPLEG